MRVGAKTYLENLVIQKPGAEHGDAPGADGGMVSPGERLGDRRFTIHNDGNRLLFHADRHTVPSDQGKDDKAVLSLSGDLTSDLLKHLKVLKPICSRYFLTLVRSEYLKLGRKNVMRICVSSVTTSVYHSGYCASVRFLSPK